MWVYIVKYWRELIPVSFGIHSHLVTHPILPAVLYKVSLMLQWASETPIAWKIIQLSAQLCPRGDSALFCKVTGLDPVYMCYSWDNESETNLNINISRANSSRHVCVFFHINYFHRFWGGSFYEHLNRSFSL